MYCFTPYATENQLKSNADNYNSENAETIARAVKEYIMEE